MSIPGPAVQLTMAGDTIPWGVADCHFGLLPAPLMGSKGSLGVAPGVLCR